MPTRRLELTRAALKDLGGIPKDDAAAVTKALVRYAETGDGDVRKLEGRQVRWRLRHGKWRAILTSEGLVLRVLRVRDRKDAYR